ncbi:haloacid dehalogenase type II [Pantoea agglomerans]|uniref:(S)-2-haloacid dehalogenase n=1 Tax=Enterobacter agglomerans TaxID=549 RepID=A0AAN2K821_ENTAG|nr:haloacid dehalogenase type II [Pantoea agglomerans]CAH6384922.1 Haloacid dehalogenase, type II [Pantoea agglomerans]
MKSNERFIVFDVNETLLDIEVLNPFFHRNFGDERIMRQWFSELIIYSQSLTLSGRYTPFGQLAIAVLRMVADIRSVTLAATTVEEFRRLMATLPPHPDVIPALEILKEAGFHMISLTNSSAQEGRNVLEKSGLTHYFEHQFSVEESKRFKPAPEVYRNVCHALGVDASSLRLVAAHTWDIIGAMASGWKGTLVTRTGNAVLELGEQPDITGKNLLTVAERIICTDVTWSASLKTGD